ncbi:MAG: MiaB/RimO family radical SAM methylthiotransferase [Phycisphaerales bacterium]|nr:MiaB/RimO family radical SAM methylthiotransferase [Phycisphaerales bacterium]
MTATRVYLETFGCQMNELDSELVAEMLRSHGYEFTSDRNAADVVVYNTCSVREQAENKVYSRIGEIGRLKRRGRNMVLAVVGCMAERDGENMMRRMPQVDVLCGPGELDKLPMLLNNAVGTAGVHRRDRRHVTVALQGDNSRRTATLGAAEDRLEALDLSRSFDPDFRAGSANSAYVRITRGCNKFCTYCVVPFTRGAEIHRPPDHIVDECKKLADAGVIEVTLLGQTVNHYRYEHGAAVTTGGVAQPQKGRSYGGGHGRDPLHGANTTTFADLLHRIHEEVPAIARLRFVTSYPRDFGDDVLQVMRDSPRICRYLHVPVQSGSDRILKLMNRGYTAGEYLDLIDRVKSYLPDIMLAGDFIVGFPTESDADFQATVDLLRTVRYKSSFIFKYSPRPGTMAVNKIPDDVPLSVKRARNAALLDVQAEISDAVANEQIGKTMDVLVEGASKRTRKARGDDRSGNVTLTVEGRAHDQRSDGDESSDAAVQLSGRSDGDLIVIFDGDEALQGTIIPVQITGARMLTLFGTLEAS